MAERDLTAPVGPTRNSSGALSLWVALAALVLAAAAVAVLTSVPKPGESQVWITINSVAIVTLFGVAPVGHVIGTAFGLAAILRPDARPVLGIAGLLVNLGALAMVVGLIILVFRGLGTFH